MFGNVQIFGNAVAGRCVRMPIVSSIRRTVARGAGTGAGTGA
jgi:hypothetical protein